MCTNFTQRPECQMCPLVSRPAIETVMVTPAMVGGPIMIIIDESISISLGACEVSGLDQLVINIIFAVTRTALSREMMHAVGNYLCTLRYTSQFASGGVTLIRCVLPSL